MSFFSFFFFLPLYSVEFDAIMKKIFVFILLIVPGLYAKSQDRLKPGAIYNQGQEIFAPMVGYKGIVPNGWFGTLPQEEEVFLLIPNGNANGYMFISARQVPINELKQNWIHDFSVTDEIVISIKGEPKISGNKMWADFEVTGSREPFVGYAEAIEGGYSWTVVMILLSPVSKFQEYKNNFDQLVASSVIQEPSLGSIYGDFDWQEFLKNKYLMSYLSSTQYKEQNEVWLCADGSFRSKIKARGLLKVENSAYKGNKRGSWTAEGIGEKGKIFLNFSKNAPVVLDMEIKDDKIFINGGRFFALENNQCK